MLVADVGDVHIDGVLDPGDVEEIAPVLRDQRVDERDLGAGLDEFAREVRADEAEAAGDQDPRDRRMPGRDRVGSVALPTPRSGVVRDVERVGRPVRALESATAARVAREVENPSAKPGSTVRTSLSASSQRLEIRPPDESLLLARAGYRDDQSKHFEAAGGDASDPKRVESFNEWKW